MDEILIIVIVGAAILALPLAALVTAIVALVKLGGIQRRLRQLESRLSRPEAAQRVVAEETAEDAEIVAAELVPTTAAQSVEQTEASLPADRDQSDLAGLETFIGQKAFGWLAVVLFVFAAAFFLRYAYQNNWIGPVGRVAIAEMVGAALVVAGWRYHRQGWHRFSNMLTAAGIVVVYLATYSAFGFYRLLPQRHAGIFLAILIAESMVAAVIYRSLTMAIVAVLGGLITPLLMHSVHDDYQSLFLYLAIFNVGVVGAHFVRSWTAVASIAYLGTQALFWSWYHANYHPEKLAWAFGFQATLFAVYLTHNILASITSRRRRDWEAPIRLLMNASLSFAAFYVLIRYDSRTWLGSMAMLMALVHAIAARIILTARPLDQRLLITSLAAAVGFVALAIPLQADAQWVALGWASMAAVLWAFGIRISSGSMRVMAGVLMASALIRLLTVDLPLYTRDPFIPILNGFALPSLGVVALLLAAVLLSEKHRSRLTFAEAWAMKAASVVGVLVLWLILSLECYGYFDSQSIGTGEVQLWRWRGQLALTVLWTLLASAMLGAGFRWKRVRLRWIGIGLFVVTAMKLFFVDMANVQQLYRILAFLVLSIVLAIVARAYQRMRRTP